MLLRHQRGLMMPWIHQILTHREVKFEAVMEDVTKVNSTIRRTMLKNNITN
jgi:hypothetical protein